MGDAGLFDTATNENVRLVQTSSTVVTGELDDGTEVFTLTVKPDGSLELAQFRALVHGNTVDHDEQVTLRPTSLPTLEWFQWQGVDQPGGERGPWGWIPKICLKGGSWQTAWSEKLCTLTVNCLDPEDRDRALGQSIIQFMSYDMEAADFASGTFHIVHMDEPPPWAIWRENQARVLDVNGRLFLSLTWPADPSIPVHRIYYERHDRRPLWPDKHRPHPRMEDA